MALYRILSIRNLNISTSLSKAKTLMKVILLVEFINLFGVVTLFMVGNSMSGTVYILGQ